MSGPPRGWEGSALAPWLPGINQIVAEDAHLRQPRGARAIREQLGIEVGERTVQAYAVPLRRRVRDGMRAEGS
ncbi:MAG: hypothetical protein ACRDRJ_05715 [Streptosporangiaceae bacterium]